MLLQEVEKGDGEATGAQAMYSNLWPPEDLLPGCAVTVAAAAALTGRVGTGIGVGIGASVVVYSCRRRRGGSSC